MSGSGGGTTTQQTTNKLPAWAVPYAQQLLGLGANTMFPGGQVGQMPADMNKQVAGFTPDQLQAMSLIQQRAGGPALANVGDQTQAPVGTVAPPPGTAAPTAASIPVAMNTNAPASNPPVAVAPTQPGDPVQNPITNPPPPPPAKTPKNKKKA